MSEFLYYSPNSPYVKKVIVAARELGIEGQINAERCITDPYNYEVGNIHVNPGGKVPTLISKDGKGYFGSQTILQYLDGISGEGKLFPKDPIGRTDAMTLEAIADIILDSSLLVRYETASRDPSKAYDKWIEAQLSKIQRALDALYKRLPDQPKEKIAGANLPDPDTKGILSSGGIAAACALWYLDKRISEHLDWRKGEKGQALNKWYEAVSKRPSLASPH